MIQSRQELEHTIKTVAKMYSLRDRNRAEIQGDPGTHEDELLGIVLAIRKLERELSEYLRSHSLTDAEYPEIEAALAGRDTCVPSLLSQTPEKVVL